MATTEELRPLIAAFMEEQRQASGREVNLDGPAARAILSGDDEAGAALLVLAVETLVRPRGVLGRGRIRFGSEDYRVSHGLQVLAGRLLRRALPLYEAQLATLLHAVPRSQELGLPLALAGLVGEAERMVAAYGLRDRIEEALRGLRRHLTAPRGSDVETRRLLTRVDALLGGRTLPVDHDEWGRALLSFLEELEAEPRAAWTCLLRHAALASGKARPSGKWSQRAAELVEAIGAQGFAERVQAWMQSASFEVTCQGMYNTPRRAISDSNQDLLKGLIWATALLEDGELAHAVASFGERCFRKIPGVGAASGKLGNACIHALSTMPGGLGVAHLSRLTGKVRYATGKRTLERALDGAAARAGQTREDLEELSVPDAGLDAEGVRRVALGDHQAELRVLDGSRVELRWLRPDGKPQASVPKAVKEAQAEPLRALRKEHKQLEALLEGQTARLQRLWMMDRRLPLGELRRRYLEHPLVGQIARRLIWVAESGGQSVALLWQDGRLAPMGGGPRELADDAEARLWHVLDCPDLQELLVWRDFLEARELRQPFKQVWREVYRPRSSEASSDDRFAGHLIRQHPFRNLCQQRGWQYTVQGYWDSANAPTLRLPRWGLTVTLEAEPIAHQRDQSYIFSYLVVGRVQFFRSDDELVHNEPLRLGEIPPLVFSEVMRDVDLFVGVSTVANEPSFDEAGIKEDWRRYWAGAVFGELAPLALTRREVLARVLPRTILRDRARLEERWLVVEGRGGPHRIHLGTGNVQRDGTEGPVVVEADRQARARTGTVFLPFEGDAILTSILARAFLLAGE